MAPGKHFRAAALVFIFILSAPLISFSQRKIDSLRTLLGVVRDTAKISVLNQLAYRYNFSNPDSGRKYAEAAISEAERIKDKKGLARAYLNLADHYSNINDSVQALANFKRSIAGYDDLKDKNGAGDAYNGMGNFYFRTGNYPGALSSYVSSLRYYEAIGNKKESLINYYCIGNIYFYQGDLVTAMDYHKRSLKLAEEIDDKLEIAFCYDNIAAVLMAQNNFTEAEVLAIKAMKIREERNYKGGLLASYNNLGVIYQNLKQNEKALVYYKKVNSLSEEMGNLNGIAISLNNIAEIYNTIGEHSKAIEYFTKSITASRRINYMEVVKAGYRGLSLCYASLNDYRNAYYYQGLHAAVKDSLLNESSSRQMSELRTKYETEKKELEISTLNKDKQLLENSKKLDEAELNKQRLINYSVSSGLLLVGVLAFFIFRGYRQKQAANMKLEEKNTLIEAKNKNITDSINYARRIQRAIITSSAYMRKHLPEHFVLYKPKDIVSGDFYWSYSTGDQLILATADCTGHGVPGAFMSMIGASKLSEIIIDRKVMEPAAILDQLRDEVIKALNPEGAEEISQDGMDICVWCYDVKSRVLRFAGANNGLYLVRENDLMEYKPDKQPVGKFSGMLKPFSQNSVQLKENDIVYTFTDGYSDQFGGEHGKKFKYKQLQELLLSIKNKPMEEQRMVLDRTIETWRGGLEQVDDILLVGVRF